MKQSILIFAILTMFFVGCNKDEDELLKADPIVEAPVNDSVSPGFGLEPGDSIVDRNSAGIKVIYDPNQISAQPSLGIDELVFCPSNDPNHELVFKINTKSASLVVWSFNTYGSNRKVVESYSESGLINISSYESAMTWVSAKALINDVWSYSDSVYIDMVVFGAMNISHPQHPAIWTNEPGGTASITLETTAPEMYDEHVFYQWSIYDKTDDSRTDIPNAVQRSIELTENSILMDPDDVSGSEGYILFYGYNICPDFEMTTGVQIVVTTATSVPTDLSCSVVNQTVIVNNEDLHEYATYALVETTSGSIIDYNTTGRFALPSTSGTHKIATFFWGGEYYKKVALSNYYTTHINSEATVIF